MNRLLGELPGLYRNERPGSTVHDREITRNEASMPAAHGRHYKQNFSMSIL